ncbi:MAG: hypothetical protein ACO1OT_15340 [Heyndrickxia sp.]
MKDQENSIKKPSDSKGEGSIWAGIGIGIAIYLLTLLIGMMNPQLFFAGPIVHLIAIITFFAKGKKFTGIGLLILAGIMILLVSACFGLVIFSLNNAG